MCVGLCRFARTYLERSVARHTRWHVEGERPSILVRRLPTRRPRLQRLQYSKMVEKNKGDDLVGRCEWHGSENGIANHRGTGGGDGRATWGAGGASRAREKALLLLSSSPRSLACAELKDPKVPRGSSHSDEYSVTNHSMWHGRIESAKSRTPLPGAVLRDTLAAARAEITVRGGRGRGASRTGGSGLCVGCVLERGTKAETLGIPETECRGSMCESHQDTPRRMRAGPTKKALAKRSSTCTHEWRKEQHSSI